MTSSTNPFDPSAAGGQPTGATTPSAGAVPAPLGMTLPAAAAVEVVSRGVLYSLASIPLGMVVAVLIWKAGFVASISSFLIAGSAVFLYRKGAMAAPRRGLIPLMAVIVVGVVASFLAIVGADLVDYYNSPDGQGLGYASVVDFVSANLFNPSVLSSYGSDLGMFALFAALGVFGTMRRLLGSRRR